MLPPSSRSHSSSHMFSCIFWLLFLHINVFVPHTMLIMSKLFIAVPWKILHCKKLLTEFGCRYKDLNMQVYTDVLYLLSCWSTVSSLKNSGISWPVEHCSLETQKLTSCSGFSAPWAHQMKMCGLEYPICVITGACSLAGRPRTCQRWCPC
jgi:hypothetical protein